MVWTSFDYLPYKGILASHAICFVWSSEPLPLVSVHTNDGLYPLWLWWHRARFRTTPRGRRRRLGREDPDIYLGSGGGGPELAGSGGERPGEPLAIVGKEGRKRVLGFCLRYQACLARRTRPPRFFSWWWSLLVLNTSLDGKPQAGSPFFWGVKPAH